MILRPALEPDLQFVLRTERLPGYENTVGQWDFDTHAAEIRRPSSRYLIAEQNGEPVGFAIMQTLDDPGGNIYLKRIAVTRQGEGIGRRILAALQDWVFAHPEAHRLHLHYSAANERGRRAYARAGFVVEGIEREAYRLRDGSRVDAVHVSILRREWQARRTV